MNEENKLAKDFYLRRINCLEKELKDKDDKIKSLNGYIEHLEDIYNDIVKLINDNIGDEFYINLEYDERLLYRIREYISGSDNND